MAEEVVTFEEVWRLFKQSAEQIQALRQALREQAEQIREQAAETDRRIQRQVEETDRRIQRQIEEMSAQMRATREAMREQAAQTDALFRKLRQDISDLTNGWGRFTESMVKPAIVRLFQQRGVPLNYTSERIESRRPGAEMEIDLLGVNEEYAVAVEVKTTLKTEDVDTHLERLAKFKLAFPEYKDKKVLGAVAGMHVPESVGRYAYKKGLYVLAQSGETMRILNDEKFKPRVW